MLITRARIFLEIYTRLKRSNYENFGRCRRRNACLQTFNLSALMWCNWMQETMDSLLVGRRKKLQLFLRIGRRNSIVHIYLFLYSSPHSPHTYFTHTDIGHPLAHSFFSIITNLNRAYSSSEVVPRRPMVDGDARQWRLPGLRPWAIANRIVHLIQGNLLCTLVCKTLLWDPMLR